MRGTESAAARSATYFKKLFMGFWISGISESAIKSAVEKVIIAVHPRFVKKYLRPPTRRREAKKEALAFHNISGYLCTHSICCYGRLPNTGHHKKDDALGSYMLQELVVQGHIMIASGTE